MANLMIAIANSISSNYFVPTGIIVFDPNAQAFINAAGITNVTQQIAINQLVLDLKAYNIWNKMRAIYPFVGGSASSHKWNLKDPQDLDSSFRLVFYGGYTHSINGIQGNGTNAYADTFFVPETVFDLSDNLHISLYIRTEYESQADLDMGGYNASQINGTGALFFVADGFGTTLAALNSPSIFAYSNTNSRAFYIATRIGSTHKIFRNSEMAATLIDPTAIKLNNKIAISGVFSYPAYGSGVDIGLLSAKQYAFSSIGDGLTDAESVNFYKAVQTYQINLGRQV